MRRGSPIVLGVLAATLLAGCGGTRSTKAIASARVGQVFYLCCNVRYDKDRPEITNASYSQGTLIPFATRVEVQKLTRDSVRFEAAGHPAITLEYKYGAKALPFEQYLGRLFVTDDPRLKLKKVPARQVKLIEKGLVAPGMSRDQVVLALGYPPADRTPSLEAPTWTYVGGTGETFAVYFDGSLVSQVQRAPGAAKSRSRKSN